jgi:hypothetical protein
MIGRGATVGLTGELAALRNRPRPEIRREIASRRGHPIDANQSADRRLR